MIGILVAVIVVVGIALTIALYTLLLTSLYPESIRTNEIFYVRTNDLWKLRVCRYRKGRAAGEPVLLVHGMGANQNNFTCPEHGCLVDYLCEKGYDCWTVDLRGCRSSEAPFERTRDEVQMEDFFREDIPAVIAHILKVTNYAKVHWVGHSMGGMLLYAYALHTGADDIASGTTLGSPLDFSDAAGDVPTWLLVVAEKCPGVAGNFIRGIVPIVKTLRLGSSVFPINHKNLPNAITAGHFINMLENPLPALMRQVRHWIKTREYTLLDGRLDIAERIVDHPVPLLAFFAARDPFINVERARKWFDEIKTDDKKMVVCAREHGFSEDYNHCDLAFSKEAAKEIFAPVVQWMQAYPAPMRAAIKREAERVSATTISEEKRANILSGHAYAHITDSDIVKEEAPINNNEKEQLTATFEATAEADAPDWEPTRPDAEEPLSEVEDREHTVAKGVGEAPEQLDDADPSAASVNTEQEAARVIPDTETRSDTEKTPATKKSTTRKASKKKGKAKKTAPKKSGAKKTAATKRATAKKKAAPSNALSNAAEPMRPHDEDEEGAPSPEAQERADKAREDRNTTFSELMASLSKPLERDPED